MLEKIHNVLIRFTETLIVQQLIHKILERFLNSIKYTFFCVMGVFLAIIFDGINNSQSKFDHLNSFFKNLISYQINPENIGEFDSFKIITFIILCVITLTLSYLADPNPISRIFMLGAGILSFLFNTTPEITYSAKIENYNNEIGKIALVNNQNFLINQRNNFSLQILLIGKEDNEKARIIVKSPNGLVYYNFLSLENRIAINVPREDWYRIIVEVDGYKIEDTVITSSETNRININLSKSNIPIQLQRFYRSITKY